MPVERRNFVKKFVYQCYTDTPSLIQIFVHPVTTTLRICHGRSFVLRSLVYWGSACLHVRPGFCLISFPSRTDFHSRLYGITVLQTYEYYDGGSRKDGLVLKSIVSPPSSLSLSHNSSSPTRSPRCGTYSYPIRKNLSFMLVFTGCWTRCTLRSLSIRSGFI